MLPTPLLPQNKTTEESAKGLDCTVIVVLLILFGVTIGAFIYYTLPSRDPVDLGVQTLEMQQANYCAGRCCYPRSQPPIGKTNALQAGALVFEMLGNKGCVECPDYWNLKILECPTTNQTVPQ